MAVRAEDSQSIEYARDAESGTALTRMLVASTLALLTAVGLWLRLRNLGALGLIVDEGVQALAVRGILDSGLPVLTSGWVYSRGVLFSYLQAAAAIGPWGLNETTLRLPATLFGAATIGATYWFARSVFDRWVGLLAATLITFSVWEIELARYARFYTAFQFFYLLALTCFLLGFIRGRPAYRIAFALVSLLAFATHELSVMLLTCFAVPWLSPQTTRAEKKKLVFWGTGLGVVWFLQRRLTTLLESLHNAPAYLEPSYTSGVEQAKSALRSQVNLLVRVHTPDMTALDRLVQGRPLIAGLVAAVLIGITGWLIWRYGRDHRTATGTAVAMMWTSALYQFGLASILLLAGLVLWAHGWRWLWSPPLRVAYAVCAGFLLMWTSLIVGIGMAPVQDLALLYAGFPDVYGYFLQWYVGAWPVFLLIFARGCFVLMDRFLHDRSDLTPVFVLGVIFIPAVLTGFLRWRYIEARYTFQLYPIMMTVFAFTLANIGRSAMSALRTSRAVTAVAVAGVVLAAAMFLSQDANPNAALAVSGRTYADRRDPIKSVLNWEFYAHFHQDHRTPAEYAASRMEADDVVVVFGPAHMGAVYAYYLDRVDYLLERQGRQEYIRRDTDGNLVSYIAGSRVIDSAQALADVLAAPRSGAVWLFGDRMLLHPENHYYGDQVKALVAQLAQNPTYVGEDGQTFVVRIP